ncbi:hypothetical protein OJAV_G00218230 [Oryzias javanicus]|uniref:Uncharacterized protein n=1 Tax=Oryzias javanicus TaxID=123683 RepID=A0A437C4V7_ORYJA|nr:hypothetical protein OJAV_G00218230 [Oryzias javanicus]
MVTHPKMPTRGHQKELGDPLGQPALLAGQDHLQHVSVQLLHHHKHSLRSLKHAVQVHDAGVVQALRDHSDKGCF